MAVNDRPLVQAMNWAAPCDGTVWPPTHLRVRISRDGKEQVLHIPTGRSMLDIAQALVRALIDDPATAEWLP